MSSLRIHVGASNVVIKGERVNGWHMGEFLQQEWRKREFKLEFFGKNQIDID